MISRLERYFLREITAPFLLGILVYTATLLVNNILKLAKLLISKGVSFDIVINLLLLMLPDMLTFTIPMSVLLAVMAGLSRMSSDSEILALKTLGFGYGRIVRPILLFSLLAMLITGFITMEIAPEANYQLNILLNRVAMSQSVVDIKAGIFYSDLPFMHLYISEIGKDGEWRNILLYVMKNPKDDVMITARRGRIINLVQQNQTFIQLYDGIIHTYKRRKPQEYTITYFAERREKIERGTILTPPRRYSQLNFKQLLREKARDPGNIMVQTEFHNKLALPAACIFLGVLALPLGISTRRGGKSSGFVISLLIILIYYILLTSGRNFILEKHLPPWFGVWLANIFIIVTALIFNLLLALEIPFQPERLFARLREWRAKRHGRKRVLLLLRMELPSLSPLRILTRYILRRLLFFFLLFFSALLFIYYLISFIDLLDDAIENKTPITNIIYYNYHLTPEIALSIVPIALLAAVLLTFSLMSRNNELTAIKVSGINLYRMIAPILVFALLVSLACFYIQEKVQPQSNSKAFYYMNRVHNRKQFYEFEFQRNWLFSGPDTIIFYQFFEKSRQRFTHLNLITLNSDMSLKGRISCEEARFRRGWLILKNGFRREWKISGEGRQMPVGFSTFKTSKINTSMKLEEFFKRENFSTFMNIRELKRYISYLRSRQSNVSRYLSMLYFNYVYPFTTLILVMIALPFSFMMGKKGTLAGMGIAVFIAVSYWAILGVFNSLGSIGVLPPLIANLIIPLLFALFSLGLLMKLPR